MDRCRRGSLRSPGRHGRAPGCVRFHGSLCECGQESHRRKDSARCHLQGEKKRASTFVLTSSEQQEEDSPAAHGILYKMSLHNQAHCLLRGIAQQGLISSLIWDPKDEESWDKDQRPKPKPRWILVWAESFHFSTLNDLKMHSMK